MDVTLHLPATVALPLWLALALALVALWLLAYALSKRADARHFEDLYIGGAAPEVV